MMLITPAFAGEVSYRPAGTPNPNAPPSWEHKPNEVSDKYLSLVRDRIGLLETAEAEARATYQVLSDENRRMRNEITRLQAETEDTKKENADLKKELNATARMRK